MVEPAIRQFVLKVSARCNLACDYCYVYESVDQSWRAKPKRIARETVQVAARRIAEHAQAHGLAQVCITLHGGEPLLLGHQGLRQVVDDLRSEIGRCTNLELGLQTNGVLLDEPFAEYLWREGVRVGISLDGGREANDRHRRFSHGGGSYDRVVAAVELMGRSPYRDLFAGILATVDVANDPVRLFHDLKDLRPGRIDLLLPHATWDSPPPDAKLGRTVYGDWLVAFFDAWYDAPPVIEVRLFQEMMCALLGGVSLTESVGLSSPESIVVESDGSFERSDILKIAYEGAPSTGYNVFEHSLEGRARAPCGHRRGAGAQGSFRQLSAVSDRHGLRWRVVCAPLPHRKRLRQSLGVLPRPRSHHRSCQRSDVRGPRPTPCDRVIPV